jgi:hypothetical protein
VTGKQDSLLENKIPLCVLHFPVGICENTQRYSLFLTGFKEHIGKYQTRQENYEFPCVLDKAHMEIDMEMYMPHGVIPHFLVY